MARKLAIRTLRDPLKFVSKGLRDGPSAVDGSCIRVERKRLLLEYFFCIYRCTENETMVISKSWKAEDNVARQKVVFSSQMLKDGTMPIVAAILIIPVAAVRKPFSPWPKKVFGRR